jgi:acyl-CoA synthetase (AMP-forming)/AMP-acid ligase II/acyl carrier protein
MDHSSEKLATFTNIAEILSFRAQADSHDRGYTFLADGEHEKEHYSFRELDRRAKVIGAFLQDSGFVGKQVLLLYQPGLEFLAGFFGCLYCGAVAVPAYPPRANKHSSRIQAIVNDADVRVVLTSSSLLPKLESQNLLGSQLTPLRLIATDTLIEYQGSSWNPPVVDRNFLAFLQYTSGSTGSPKGVMVSHENLIQNQRMIQKAFGHTEDSIIVGWLPLFHDMGLVGNILQPLWLGTPCILMSPTAFLQKPVRWLQAISSYRATTSGGPNFAYDLCVRTITPEQQENLNLSSWDLAFNGAEPIHAKTLERFAKRFGPQGFRKSSLTPCYGLAEGTLLVTSGPKAQGPKVISLQNKGLQNNLGLPVKEDQVDSYDVVSSGKPWLEGKIAIVHPETGNQCKDGQVGEVWIQGPHVAQGYWNQPDITRDIFMAYIKNSEEAPYLRSGDLGFVKDGELYVTGRLKDLIIIRGLNHYPQDIERTVAQSHPALRSGGGAAFTVEVHEEEQLVVIQEVERAQLKKINVDQIIGLIRERISESHELQVHRIVLLKPGSVPKTSSGKIQRQECRTQFLRQEWSVVGTWGPQPGEQSSEIAIREHQKVEPFSRDSQSYDQKDIEEFIIRRLSYWLKVPTQNLDVEETFAHYGLDSSMAVSLIGEVGDYLQTQLDPTIIWDYPNIRSVAKYLHEEISSGRNASDAESESDFVPNTLEK